jgi:hypothetical protein
LIHDIPTCKDLCERIEREAVGTLQKAQSLFVPETAVPDETNTVDRSVHVEGGPNLSKPGQNQPGAEVWGIGKSKL